MFCSGKVVGVGIDEAKIPAGLNQSDVPLILCPIESIYDGPLKLILQRQVRGFFVSNSLLPRHRLPGLSMR